ncbi:MAG: hypothetical protein AAB649_06940, partial [Patescibacteria group bacterium]
MGYIPQTEKAGTWFKYNDEKLLWEQHSVQTIEKCVRQLLGDDDSTRAKVTNTIFHLRSVAQLDDRQMNSYPHLLHLSNCSYDLIKMEPVARTKDLFITHATEYEYQEGAECPTIDEQLFNYSNRDENWV